MALMSLALFIAMGRDKQAAKSGCRRTPERRLFALALLGGATGGSLGMFLFRHKTRHWYFRLGFPLLAVAQWGLWLWLCLAASV